MAGEVSSISCLERIGVRRKKKARRGGESIGYDHRNGEGETFTDAWRCAADVWLEICLERWTLISFLKILKEIY